MTEYALITGASKGIGKSIALLLAKAGYNLLLVARSETALLDLSVLIQKDYNVKVAVLAIDLSAEGAAENTAKWCKSQTSVLTVLINNAGYGLWGAFSQLSITDQMNMLQLNIRAVVELTYHLLPLLKQQKQAYIMNIASTAAYQALPNFSLYAASKTFILNYSRAIRYELKHSVVAVSCLCPGPTDTAFASRAGLDAFADLAAKFNMAPGEVAETGLKGMFDKKAEIIPGFLNKVSSFFASHLPKAMIEKIGAGLYTR
ncbi:MAG: SDR family oxidoreductase [Pedobacter sp.]|uniref:SDR family NAD(P)-dependent oxidoreductase n=1 Tax=Pedobacter sp. TaxID=1411316 RepID=UPI00339A8F6D